MRVIWAINWFKGFLKLIHNYRERNLYHRHCNHHADIHRIEVARTIRECVIISQIRKTAGSGLVVTWLRERALLKFYQDGGEGEKHRKSLRLNRSRARLVCYAIISGIINHPRRLAFGHPSPSRPYNHHSIRSLHTMIPVPSHPVT